MLNAYLRVLFALNAIAVPYTVYGKGVDSPQIICSSAVAKQLAGMRILIIGDSLSAYETNYPAMLERCGLKVLRLAKGGKSTYWMERVLSHHMLTTLLLVDAVIVFGGHNNFGRRGRNDAKETIKSLANMYRAIGKRRLIALTLSPFGGFDWEGGCQTYAKRSICRREARQLRWEWHETNNWILSGADGLVDPKRIVNVSALIGEKRNPWMLKAQYHGRDGLHPPQEAHRVLAKAILQVLRR